MAAISSERIPATDSGCSSLSSGSGSPVDRCRPIDDSPSATEEASLPDGECCVQPKLFKLSISGSSESTGSQESIGSRQLQSAVPVSMRRCSDIATADANVPLTQQNVTSRAINSNCMAQHAAALAGARKISDIYPLLSAASIPADSDSLRHIYSSTPDLATNSCDLDSRSFAVASPLTPRNLHGCAKLHSEQRRRNVSRPISLTPEHKSGNRNSKAIFKFPLSRLFRRNHSSSSNAGSMADASELQELTLAPVNNNNNACGATTGLSAIVRPCDRLKAMLIQNPTATGDERYLSNELYNSPAAAPGATCKQHSNLSAQHSVSQEDPGPSRFLDNSYTPCSSCASKSASCPSLGNVPGMRYKLIKEGQVQICRLNHPRSVLGKIAHTKLLRRWETHTLVLDKEEIWSRNQAGFMETSIALASVEDVHIFTNYDSADRFCIRIYIPDGSILIQTNHSYSRNQWLHSIIWRRNMLRCKRMFEKLERADVVIRELKNLVLLVQNATLQDDSIYTEPLELCAIILQQIERGKLPQSILETVIVSIGPLLENFSPIPEVCSIFSKFCRESPRSSVIDGLFTDVANQILKKNMDFGKNPSLRTLVQDVILALNCKNNGLAKVREFVETAHGPASTCPHPRVLPNLISVSLAAVSGLYDAERTQYEDWRLPVASILQPIPFPDSVLSHPLFIKYFEKVVLRIGTDCRCDVHLSILAVREGKDGWFHLFCPGWLCCLDEGEIYSKLLKTLLHCCCKRKKFFVSLNGMLGPLQLLALRECDAALEALCYMLELEVVENEDMKLQMITALQSTPSGKKHYAQLCDRQIALRELQQKGGPRKLTLPSKSTDQDLAVLLSSGSFGNLEWLSLAFTNVTSSCAEYLVKLPSLKYLNLWSTQFGDLGVHLISEHLHRLQVLNLCETPVTDKGLLALTALKSLRKLNLNSTQLSARTFQILRSKLPALQEADIRYTDAWCADDVVSG